MADQIYGFISYAHEDEKLRKELGKHLKTLGGPAIFWDDHMIMPGEDWNEAILGKLHIARVILLLISVDFIASDYIERIEVQQAMERSERGEACVIPIILRPVSWDTMPYHKLQALPEGAKPVEKWGSRDDAFVDIIQGIRKAINSLNQMQMASTASRSQEERQGSRFHEALLDLDYNKQAETFRQFIEMKDRARVGAFLIHGESYYGQNWLLHRLINNTGIENIEKAQFKFSFTRNIVGMDLDELWDSLSQWLGGSASLDSPKSIVDQVYQLWLQQSVILKMGSIERTTEKYLQEFLRLFWEPLVETIHRESLEQKLPNNYLLLFLIDNEGFVEDWNNNWMNQFDTSTIPVKLKKIHELTDMDVDIWIKSHINILPSTLTVQEALAKGRIPEVALKQICKVCGYRWYEQEGVRL